MPEQRERVYESPSSEPGDEFWLEQGKKMVEGSIEAVREAAKALMTGAGVVQGIYLGILGLTDYIPKTMPLPQKSLFIVPLALMLISLYYALQTMMTEEFEVNLRSPDDIRQLSEHILHEKQQQLRTSFWAFAIGIVAAIVLFLLRVEM